MNTHHVGAGQVLPGDALVLTSVVLLPYSQSVLGNFLHAAFAGGAATLRGLDGKHDRGVKRVAIIASGTNAEQ